MYEHESLEILRRSKLEMFMISRTRPVVDIEHRIWLAGMCTRMMMMMMVFDVVIDERILCLL